MLSRIDVAIDCVDVDAQARFWAEALGYAHHGTAGQYRSLLPPPGVAGPKLILQQVDEPRLHRKNRLHLDLIVGDVVDAEVERLERLGARRLGDRITEHGSSWVVLADPEGNEFCVCET